MKREDIAAHIDLVRMVIQRLERLSADSAWARRASGARGALLKAVERAQSEPELGAAGCQQLSANIVWAFYVLERAARELT